MDFEQGTVCLACIWDNRVRLSEGGEPYSPLSMSHSDCRQVVQAHVQQLAKPSIRCTVMLVYACYFCCTARFLGPAPEFINRCTL